MLLEQKTADRSDIALWFLSRRFAEIIKVRRRFKNTRLESHEEYHGKMASGNRKIGLTNRSKHNWIIIIINYIKIVYIIFLSKDILESERIMIQKCIQMVGDAKFGLWDEKDVWLWNPFVLSNFNSDNDCTKCDRWLLIQHKEW